MPCYYWKDGAVLIKDEYVVSAWAEAVGVEGHLCVDDNYLENPNSFYRYGMSVKGYWKHVPYKDFPAPFKMELLLLGVS